MPEYEDIAFEEVYYQVTYQLPGEDTAKTRAFYGDNAKDDAYNFYIDVMVMDIQLSVSKITQDIVWEFNRGVRW